MMSRLSLSFLRLSSSSLVSANELRKVMQCVPTSVVVVTSRDQSDGRLRGVTCSSFTSVSSNPPIVSFCMQNPSRFHNILTRTEKFAVNVLSETQANLSIHFSTPVSYSADVDPKGERENNTKESRVSEDQFEKVAFALDEQWGLPLIQGAVAHLVCEAKQFHEMGDHFVWYGNVLSTIPQTNRSFVAPLLFFGRSYRSIGDDAFIAAFEDTTLPFDFWTHKAHLRMAWNYLKHNDLQASLDKVRRGINRFNASNSDKVIFGYSETISYFFLTMVHQAMRAENGSQKWENESFEDFLDRNPQLTDSKLPYKFYSKDVLLSDEAKSNFVPPDLQEFRTEEDSTKESVVVK